jgi:hypothetical protein
MEQNLTEEEVARLQALRQRDYYIFKAKKGKPPFCCLHDYTPVKSSEPVYRRKRFRTKRELWDAIGPDTQSVCNELKGMIDSVELYEKQ